MDKKDVLEELDVVDTYFKEVIDKSAALEYTIEEIFILNQLKSFVKDATDFIKDVEEVKNDTKG